MNASTVLALALLLPIAASVTAIVLFNAPGERTAPTLLLAAGAAAAGVLVAMQITGEEALWRGFESTPWRAVLAGGALLCAAGATVRARNAWSAAASGVAAAGAVVSMFGRDTLWTGLGLLVTTAAIATAVYVAKDDRAAGFRAIVPLLLSDVAVLAGFALATSDTLQIDRLTGAGGWFTLIGGSLRLALLPPFVGEARRAGIGGLVEGPARAQGLLVCSLAAAGSGDLALGLAIVGAVGCAWAWLASDSHHGAVALAGAAAAVGFGIGGAPGTWGAMLAAVSGLAASAVAAGGARSLPKPVFGVAPVAGAFIGVALVASAAVRLAAARPEYAPIAVALLAGTIAAAASAWRATAAEPEEPAVQGEPAAIQEPAATEEAEPVSDEPAAETVVEVVVPARPTWSKIGFGVVVVIGVVVAGAIAFAPSVAISDVVRPVAADLGVASPLQPLGDSPTRDLGIVFGALALAGLLAGGGGRPMIEDDATAARPWVEMPATERTTEWTRVATAGLGVAFACGIWLFLAAGARGWL